ncbi:MAG: type II toxin-antitoxin system HicA family toxin [Chloroflexota bacterium]|nr:type II toxin-antitoxin system HicA family toxin [Chloroflexota bacterium]
MKVKDAIRLIDEDGWYLVATKGSHRQYKHAEKKGRVTIAGELSKTLHPKTLASVLKQAQIELKENE